MAERSTTVGVTTGPTTIKFQRNSEDVTPRLYECVHNGDSSEVVWIRVDGVDPVVKGDECDALLPNERVQFEARKGEWLLRPSALGPARQMQIVRVGFFIQGMRRH